MTAILDRQLRHARQQGVISYFTCEKAEPGYRVGENRPRCEQFPLTVELADHSESLVLLRQFPHEPDKLIEAFGRL